MSESPVAVDGKDARPRKSNKKSSEQVKEQSAGTDPVPGAQRHAASEKGDEKKPYVPKPIGEKRFELKEVPREFRELAISKLGKPGMKVAEYPAKENGEYAGVVVNGEKFLAQRLSESTIVYHNKSDVEFISNTDAWRDKVKTLNGADLRLYYEGDKAKAYPRDPEREEVVKWTVRFTNSEAVKKLTGANAELVKQVIQEAGGEVWKKVLDRRALEQKERTNEPRKRQREQEQSR